MSVRLRDLIKAVRAAKTAAQERSIIQKEAALIRTEFSKGTPENRQRNIAKLLYMSTLGYPTKWGQMECIKLIASHDYMDKRIGYLALNLLLDEHQEVLMLATQQIKTDINHHQRFISGLALTTLGNIASEQICRDCAGDIERLLNEPDVLPYRRKKAVLCALKIVRKVPDLAEQFIPSIKNLLQDSDHGVLICTVSLMLELCNIEGANYKKTFQTKYVSGLVRILKNVHKAGYAPEYDVGNISDPFLQVRLLRLLRILGSDDQAASDKMNEVLAMIATNTDTLRNVGNAILYECVNTIMSIKSDQDLRVMAINTLGKFLSNKDNNIRYVALFSLCKAVDADTEVVQRDRGKIVDCLKDPDRSIRRRALHLIYSLVDTNNVRNLVRELLAVLLKADIEFRAELTAKLCYVSEKFSPNQRWLIDTLLRVMSIAGEHVPEQVQFNLIGMITRNPPIQNYAVQKVWLAINEEASQDVLNQVGVWCIGEFGDVLTSQPIADTGVSVSPTDILNILEQILTSSTSNVLTKEYVLTALFKLAHRLGPQHVDTIKRLIEGFKTSIHLELQHRACEFSEFLQTDPRKRSVVLETIPPLVVQEGKSLGGSSTDIPEIGEVPADVAPKPPADPLGGLFTLPPVGGANQAPADPLGSLFTIPMTGGPAPADPTIDPTMAILNMLTPTNAPAGSPAPGGGFPMAGLAFPMMPMGPIGGMPPLGQPGAPVAPGGLGGFMPAAPSGLGGLPGTGTPTNNNLPLNLF